MRTYDVESGDQVHAGDPVTVDRYTTGARINHWITAVSLVLLALSGLAPVSSPVVFLERFVRRRTEYTRHTSLDRRGTVLFVPGHVPALLAGNLWKGEDGTWMARLRDVLSGHEERLPEVGKYNAGQKMVFWLMSILIIALIASGFALWDQYFAQYTQKRIAVLLHALAAIVIICVWIVHVYAAIWVRGTFRAMIKGSVTGGWAWRHHRKWLRVLVVGKRDGKPSKTKPAE